MQALSQLSYTPDYVSVNLRKRLISFSTSEP